MPRKPHAPAACGVRTLLPVRVGLSLQEAGTIPARLTIRAYYFQGGITSKLMDEAKVRLAGEGGNSMLCWRGVVSRRWWLIDAMTMVFYGAALSTNQSQKGVSFSGDALHHLYYATKFERRGLLLYSIFAQV